MNTSSQAPGPTPTEPSEAPQDDVAAYFKARYDRLRWLLAGHPDTDLMSVGEILAAVDGQDPRAGLPLIVEWDGQVKAPTSAVDTRVLIPCTAVLGGPVVLVVDAARSGDLGRLLLAVRPGPSSPGPCPAVDQEPDGEDGAR